MTSNSELQKQIDELQATLLRVKRDSEKTIQDLKNQLNSFYSPTSNKKGSTREQELLNHIANLKRIHSEELAHISTTHQKEISKFRYEVAELKNQLAQCEAKNAQLVIENLELKEKEADLERTKEHLHQWKTKLDLVLNSPIQTTQNALSDLSSKIDTVYLKFHEIQDDRQQYSKAIDYLTRCIHLISNLPSNSIPSSRECVSNPQQLISFIIEAQKNAEKQKKEIEQELAETTQNLNEMRTKLNSEQFSQPVARVLANLGNTILEMTEQLNEDHQDTLALLKSQSSFSGNRINSISQFN